MQAGNIGKSRRVTGLLVVSAAGLVYAVFLAQGASVAQITTALAAAVAGTVLTAPGLFFRRE